MWGESLPFFWPGQYFGVLLNASLKDDNDIKRDVKSQLYSKQAQRHLCSVPTCSKKRYYVPIACQCMLANCGGNAHRPGADSASEVIVGALISQMFLSELYKLWWIKLLSWVSRGWRSAIAPWTRPWHRLLWNAHVFLTKLPTELYSTLHIQKCVCLQQKADHDVRTFWCLVKKQSTLFYPTMHIFIWFLSDHVKALMFYANLHFPSLFNAPVWRWPIAVVASYIVSVFVFFFSIAFA